MWVRKRPLHTLFPQDRKEVLKTFKKNVAEIAKQEYGHMALLVVFDVVDDVKFVQKVILNVRFSILKYMLASHSLISSCFVDLWFAYFRSCWSRWMIWCWISTVWRCLCTCWAHETRAIFVQTSSRCYNKEIPILTGNWHATRTQTARWFVFHWVLWKIQIICELWKKRWKNGTATLWAAVLPGSRNVSFASQLAVFGKQFLVNKTWQLKEDAAGRNM